MSLVRINGKKKRKREMNGWGPFSLDPFKFFFSSIREKKNPHQEKRKQISSSSFSSKNSSNHPKNTKPLSPSPHLHKVSITEPIIHTPLQTTVNNYNHPKCRVWTCDIGGSKESSPSCLIQDRFRKLKYTGFIKDSQGKGLVVAR